MDPDDPWIEFCLATSEKELRKYIRRKDFEYSEEFLLRVIEKPRNKMEPKWAEQGLFSLVTRESVPALKRLGLYRVVAWVAGQDESGYYIELLTSREWRDKAGMFSCIAKTAHPSTFPEASKYVRKHRSGLKRMTVHWCRALDLGLYLHNVSSQVPEAETMLEDQAMDLLKLIEAAGMPKHRGYEASIAHMRRIIREWMAQGPDPELAKNIATCERGLRLIGVDPEPLNLLLETVEDPETLAEFSRTSDEYFSPANFDYGALLLERKADGCEDAATREALYHEASKRAYAFVELSAPKKGHFEQMWSCSRLRVKRKASAEA